MLCGHIPICILGWSAQGVALGEVFYFYGDVVHFVLLESRVLDTTSFRRSLERLYPRLSTDFILCTKGDRVFQRNIVEAKCIESTVIERLDSSLIN